MATKTKIEIEKENKELKNKLQEAENKLKTNEDILESVQNKNSTFEEELLKMKEMFEEFKNREPERKQVSGKTRIPDNIEVVIKSNLKGGFNYSNKNVPEASFSFPNYGEQDIITVKGLRTINRDSNWLRKGAVAIVDSYSDEYTVEEIINGLMLQKHYFGEDVANPNDFEKYFTDEYSARDLDKILAKNKDKFSTIIEVAVVLYELGKFKDYDKISLIKQRTRNEDIFK